MDDLSSVDAGVSMHVARCVGGAVLVGGCGTTCTFPALIASETIDKIDAVDVDEAAVATATDLADAAKDVEEEDPKEPVEEIVKVAVGDIRDRVALAIELGEKWDSVLIDVDDPEVEQDAKFHADLATLLPDGARVAVLTRDAKLSIEGFRLSAILPGDELSVVLFDRGKVEADPYAGMVRLPGRGWVSFEKETEPVEEPVEEPIDIDGEVIG